MKTTRAQRQLLKKQNQQWPSVLTPVPLDKFLGAPPNIIEVWRSRDFLVQVFQEADNVIRLTVCRTMVGAESWLDGITFDELMQIKRECGRGNLDALEVYPADHDLVNVANMRHLWIVPGGVSFAWRNSD